MDSRRFEVGTEFGSRYVDAEDVVVSEGFVIFIRVNNEEETTETVAMFNTAKTYSVMEVKTDD